MATLPGTWRYRVSAGTGSLFDVVFPLFPLSASSSLSLNCSLQDSLGQSRWSCDVLVPLQFASFYCSQEVFIRPDGFSSSGFHFLIGYGISVRDTEEFAETSHLQCLYPSFNVCGYGPRFTCSQQPPPFNFKIVNELATTTTLPPVCLKLKMHASLNWKLSKNHVKGNMERVRDHWWQRPVDFSVIGTNLSSVIGT